MNEENEVNGAGAENGNPKEMKQEAQEKIVEVLVTELNAYASNIISDSGDEKSMREQLDHIVELIKIYSNSVFLALLDAYLKEADSIERIDNDSKLFTSRRLCQVLTLLMPLVSSRELEEIEGFDIENLRETLSDIENALGEHVTRLNELNYEYESNFSEHKKAFGPALADILQHSSGVGDRYEKGTARFEKITALMDSLYGIKSIIQWQKQALENEIEMLCKYTFFLLPHQKYEVNTKRIKMKVLDALEKAIDEVAANKTDFSDVWKAACRKSKITDDDLKRAMRSEKTSRTRTILVKVEDSFNVKLSDGVYQAPSKSPGK